MASSPGGPFNPGDMIDGKYRVERVLGEGGMGIVVAALHLDLGRPVAIKLLREPFVLDGEQAARFFREGRAAVQLTGEHSVRVLDVGRLPSGSPFLVMERLHGRDLGQLVLAGAHLEVGEAVDYILQACEGVAEAHARGLVHRDLKLANLFLTKRGDGTSVVKVLDFGLVKSTAADQDHVLTRSSAVMGSPAYMSPEQMRASRNVTTATDIWSLGICLYELITGHLPFEAPNVADLMIKVLKDAPTPMHEVRPEAPPGLSQVVERCLGKETAERFSDVAELARALEPYGSLGSAGAGKRVHHWLVQSVPEVTDVAPSPALATTKEVVRTEAAWDSGRREGRARRMTWVAVTSFVALVLVVGWTTLTGPHAKPAGDAPAIVAAPGTPIPVAGSPSAAVRPLTGAGAGAAEEPQATPPPTGAAVESAVDASAPAAIKRATPAPARRASPKPAPRAGAGDSDRF